MKQVIFLCLLSLTLCLSKPAEPEVPAPNQVAKPVGDTKVDTPHEQPPVVTTPAASNKKPATAEQAPPPANTPPANTESQKPNTATDTNKTTEKKDDPAKENTTAATKIQPSNPANNTSVPRADNTTHTQANNSSEAKPATKNDTKPEDKGSKADTLPPSSGTPKSNDTSKPVEPKTPKDEDKHIVQARGFDGPSFIGGIILSLGLLAIGFMGFKYYKNQTERNYHTL